MEIAVSAAVYLVLAGTVLALRGRPAYPAAKAAAGLAFIVLAVLCALEGNITPGVRTFTAGFVLCAAGDVALGVYNLSRRTAWMAGGIGVFFCGHLCFLGGLWKLHTAAPAWLLLPAVSAGVLVVLLRRGAVNMGRLAPFGVCYCFAVSTLLAQSLSVAFALATPAAVLLCAGAALFWTSDFILLFLYFGRQGRSAGLHIANLVTYYGGILLLALSLCGLF